jgi:hypothetical protein
VSRQGPYPWAQLLSGGDYDGDLAFLSWDTALLPPPGGPERFPPPCLPVDPSKESASTHSGAVMNTATSQLRSLSLGSGPARHTALSGLLAELFRGFSPSLGVLTQMHAAWASKEGVGAAQSVRLGWLCRDAVDSPKTGIKVRVPKVRRKPWLVCWSDFS